MEKTLVAKLGTFVFVGILGMPAVLPASGEPASVFADAATTSRATSAFAYFDVASELAGMRGVDRASSVARARAGSMTEDSPAPPPPGATATPAVVTPPPVAPAQRAPAAAGPSVIASWYGPGFYGQRTACGVTLTPQTLGVADLTLPCGALVTITSTAGLRATVPVIDRGPYIAGRTLDLTYATRVALACTDLCTVRMAIP
ncbi:MAG: hypothetical protein KGJ98_00955 [Chloroflexota bacterium]|nr:hypothetical protein [Chloroflexota bacterium]